MGVENNSQKPNVAAASVQSQQNAGVKSEKSSFSGYSGPSSKELAGSMTQLTSKVSSMRSEGTKHASMSDTLSGLSSSLRSEGEDLLSKAGGVENKEERERLVSQAQSKFAEASLKQNESDSMFMRSLDEFSKSADYSSEIESNEKQIRQAEKSEKEDSVKKSIGS